MHLFLVLGRLGMYLLRRHAGGGNTEPDEVIEVIKIRRSQTSWLNFEVKCSRLMKPDETTPNQTILSQSTQANHDIHDPSSFLPSSLLRAKLAHVWRSLEELGRSMYLSVGSGAFSRILATMPRYIHIANH